MLLKLLINFYNRYPVIKPGNKFYNKPYPCTGAIAIGRLFFERGYKKIIIASCFAKRIRKVAAVENFDATGNNKRFLNRGHPNHPHLFCRS